MGRRKKKQRRANAPSNQQESARPLLPTPDVQKAVEPSVANPYPPQDDPAGKKKKRKKPGSSDAQAAERDLASILAYGPSYLPYTAAWTDSRIEQVRAFRHWVYIAIDRRASFIAAQMPNVSWVDRQVRREEDEEKWLWQQKRRYLPGVARHKALMPLHAHELIEPCPHDHPLVRLLEDPNEPDTSYDLWYETEMFLGLTGTAYWWTPLNELGLPVAAWVIPSHWMWPIVGKDRLISAYEIRPVEGNYLRKILPPEEVIVFKNKSPISKIDGYAPLTAISHWVDTQNSIDHARNSTYSNGTFPTVAIQFDSKLIDPTEEDLRRIDAKFAARYAGPQKSNRPLFLPPGVKATPLTLKPNEMIFGETAEETRDNILAAYGVPAMIAGISQHMTYGSNVAAKAAFISGTINPRLRFMSKVLSETLARKYDENLKIWWEDQTPDDPELLEKRIQTDLMAGAITPNEVRLLRGREPFTDEWANKPVLPANMQSTTTPFGGQHAEPPESTPESQPNNGKKHLSGRTWFERAMFMNGDTSSNGH